MNDKERAEIVSKWREMAQVLRDSPEILGENNDPPTPPSTKPTGDHVKILPTFTKPAPALPSTTNKPLDWKDKTVRKKHIIEATTRYMEINRKGCRVPKLVQYINAEVPKTNLFNIREVSSTLRDQDDTYSIQQERIAANPSAITRWTRERTSRCHETAVAHGFDGSNQLVNYLEPTPGVIVLTSDLIESSLL
jgi:hypothetical protein